MRSPKRGLFLRGCAVLVAPMTFAKNFDAGAKAYRQGDFRKALEHLFPFAEKGNAEAQCYLGSIYRRGEGVPRDYGKAVKWFRLAAEQRYAEAQYNLGSMYSSGEGIQQDLVRAYMWLSLAAANGDDYSVRAWDRVASQMVPSQIVKAWDLTREWKRNSSPSLIDTSNQENHSARFRWLKQPFRFRVRIRLRFGQGAVPKLVKIVLREKDANAAGPHPAWEIREPWPH